MCFTFSNRLRVDNAEQSDYLGDNNQGDLTTKRAEVKLFSDFRTNGPELQGLLVIFRLSEDNHCKSDRLSFDFWYTITTVRINLQGINLLRNDDVIVNDFVSTLLEF